MHFIFSLWMLPNTHFTDPFCVVVSDYVIVLQIYFLLLFNFIQLLQIPAHVIDVGCNTVAFVAVFLAVIKWKVLLSVLAVSAQ